MKDPTPEKQVQTAIIRLLQSHGVHVMRRNVTKVPLNGSWVQFGHEGEADLTCTLPGSGRRLEIECKAPGKRPTAKQLDFLHTVNQFGGVGLWADDVGYVQRVLPWLLEGARCQINTETGEPEFYFPAGGDRA